MRSCTNMSDKSGIDDINLLIQGHHFLHTRPSIHSFSTPHTSYPFTQKNMQEEFETTNTITTTTTTTTNILPDDMDSACSTPYVSAPSSPGHGQPLSGYYYSAPASPMHFVLSTTTFTTCNTSQAEASSASTFEFDFSAKLKSDGATSPESMTMSSADELFFNGQIRPMKLSTHLQRPQILSPLLDIKENDQDSEDQDHDQGCVSRGRDVKFRDKWSLRSRRTRSLSPLRTASFEWQQKCENYDEIITTQNEEKENDASDEKHDQYKEIIASEAAPCNSGSSSRSSSVGRSSKRWVLLKEFLYRSNSEGRNNGSKFWNGLSFSSPVKDKKMENMKMVKMPRMKPSSDDASGASSKEKCVKSQQNIAVKDPKKRVVNGKAMNGVMRKRRVPPSAHELHYTANRAQSEEMRKKTFLPYRQGLLGCLGFSSKSYGAWNGFARALNPVSSR